jgi:crotonobetainyl-CoA:carnitine CoA-transferase CaiB-like acyl-CoA transferase
MDAFEGLEVVDLSVGLAGPMVGMFLADFGADVVKVETPVGDPARRTAGFSVWNRGKRGVVVDPDDHARCAWLGDLLAGADVCLLSGPESLTQFGLDVEGLRRRAPRLVVSVVAPYEGEPPWWPTVESNGLLAAALGVAWRQSSFDGGPVESVYPQLLYVHGVLASLSTVAALVERERSGFGQTVTVSGAHAVLHAQPAALSVDPELPDAETAVGPGGRHPTYTRYQARDGKWLVSGALGAKFETALLRALDLLDMLEDPRMAGRIENLIQPENVEWALERISTAFRTRDRDEWIEIISELGIPCGPIESAENWLDHEQVRAIGMRVEIADDERGPVVMAGVPFQMTGSPGQVRGGAPRLGQHDAVVRPRRPLPPPPGLAPLVPGPLAGIRVLDLGTFVAAPYAGMLLAELGADVVKVEATGGDPFRAAGFVTNRGMRSLEVDLKSERGRAAFYSVVAHSDIVIDALRPGVSGTLGIDYDSLKGVNPAIIAISLSGFGEAGPLKGRPSVDMVLQGMSGMMSTQGGPDVPVVNTMPIIDVTTAALLALCSAIAIYHRARTGDGQRAWASLAATSALLQAGELVRYPGSPKAPVGGRDFRGTAALDRYYRVREGWLRIFAPDPALVSAGLLEASLGIDRESFEKHPSTELARALRELSADEALDRLHGSGIAATPARRISAVLRDEALLAADFVHLQNGPDGSHFTVPGRYSHFSRTPRSGVLLAPGSGEHTVELLQSAGLGDVEIEELVAIGAIARGGPMPQRLPLAYR